MKTQIMFVAVTFLASVASVFAGEPSLDANSACTNFSGNWHGSCSTNGNVAADDMPITQNSCEGLILGGLNLVVGGTITDRKVSGDVTTTSVISTAWDQSRTQLYGKYVIIMTKAGQSGQRYASLDTNVRLEGSKLVIQARGRGIDVQCSYDRR